MKQLLFFLIIILPNLTFSQIKISGTVLDKVSKKPLYLVSVYDKNSNIGTITSTDGKFNLTFKNKLVNIVFEEENYIKKELIIKSDTIFVVNLDKLEIKKKKKNKEKKRLN